MRNKVFVDALGIDRVGGGRTAIHTLLDHVFQLDRDTLFVVLVSALEPAWEKHENVDQRVIRGGRFAVRAFLQCRLPVWVRREQASLVHFTKNLGVFGLSCPYVVTVHDLTTLLLPQQHTPLDVAYWRWIEPLTARRATKVVAVSHATATDIERFYDIPKGDIEVVHWAPHSRFTTHQDTQSLEDLRRRYELPSQFILFLGILAKKKNLPTLLRSFAHLRTRRSNVPDLVVVGRRYSQSEDKISRALVHQLGLEECVHFTGAVPDKDLPLFYAAAELYVLPSLHEGFGIPCLEAMASGTPVVTTRRGALAEVTGDAAEVVEDPQDVGSLSAAMERVLYDRQLRETLIERGLRRVDDFSWSRSAHQMLDIYHTTIEGGNP
ncbi:MAG: glycosyltransferase family 1 protein [Anaerolineae bacterium]|jgi:glycosyltransferase involved in cell wall biosynthesis